MVFPELGLSGTAIEDLLHQQALLGCGARRRWSGSSPASAALRPLIVVGAPLRAEGGLFNTAVVIHRGRVLGAVPKSYLPEYREFYEKRHFRAARDLVGDELELLGEARPVRRRAGVRVRRSAGFRAPRRDLRGRVGADPAEHLRRARRRDRARQPVGQQRHVGKADYRRLLCASQSARMIAAYVFTSAGLGESTTDLAWDGQALIYENGDRLAESERFAEDEQLIFADINLDRLVSDRATTSSFGDCDPRPPSQRSRALRRIEFELGAQATRGAAATRDRAVSRTSPPIPRAAASAARRSTASRSRASRRGCARPGSRRS